MKRIASALVSAVLCCALYATSFAASAAQDLTQRLQRITTWQASFKQYVTDERGRLVSQSTGVCRLQKPGLFYWQTRKPTPQRLILNHDALWVIDEDLSQATRRARSALSIQQNPVMLLIGQPEKALAHYHVTRVGSRFTLQPVSDAKGEAALAFTLTFSGKQLTQLAFQDALQQTTRFVFDHVRVNAAIPATVFQYHPPSSMTVVRE